MSDDLVKRAREWNFCWPSRDVEMLVPAMADRIEELEAQLKSVLDREAATIMRHDARLDAAATRNLQEVLTIAIDAFKKIAACDDDNVAKYIQTVDTLALNALDALKEKLK